MNWLVLTMIATLIGGAVPIFSNKNVQIVGPTMVMLMNTAFWAVVLSVWLIFNRGQISLINKQSLVLTGAAQSLSIIGTFLIFTAYQSVPDKLSIIILTTSLSVVVTAIINNFLGHKLQPHQWMGAIIAILGISLIHLKN